MKTIQVGDGTFAKIWAKWKDGDATEDDILRRELGVLGEAPRPNGGGSSQVQPSSGGGHHDQTYGVFFPEGFKIHRIFKGKSRSAVVQDGHWMADNNRLATSLNQLSRHIGAPTENAWLGWKYTDEHGRERSISDLRDPSKVRRRS